MKTTLSYMCKQDMQV